MKNIPMAPANDAACPVTHCLSLIGGKWKPLVLFCISNGVNRFGAMQRSVPDITKQMLTQHLREMERDGLISRTVFAQIPPRVDYALTERGRSILVVIDTMRKWGEHDMTGVVAGRSKP